MVIGVVCAFIAVALLSLIGLFTNLFFYGRLALTFVSPAGNQLGPYAVAVPVLGGLIVGLMARYGSERIRGHGIPEAIEAILINRSKIEPRVTVLKPIATAISIGSGGPFGAEGPIIMTGGAFGSVLAQFLRLSAMERKTLLVAGAAAGMAATFNSPVAAVLLAVELLLFEWKPRSLIPVGFASITATVLRGVLLGTGPIFPVGPTPIPSGLIVLSAIVVGLVAGGASTLLTWGVYGSEDAFRRLPIHWMWWPALGGLVIGVGGFIAPRALGVGYDTIDALLLGQLAVGAVAALLLVKSTIWAFSLGSGTSGGVLAPLMMMGGALGALESLVLPSGTLTLWVLVGIGAMIGGTMRSPFTGVVFTLELTHDVNALLPLLAAALAADFFTVFSMKRSILTEKVARRGVHVAREYSVDVLEQVRVETAMRKDFTPVQADLPVKDLVSDFIRAEGKSVGYPVVDAVGFLQAFLTREKVFSCIGNSDHDRLTVRDLVSGPLVVAFPDEPVRAAAEKLATSGLECIPVVDPSNPQKVVGLISREDIFHTRIIWSAEERVREKHLWMPRLSVGAIARNAFEKLRKRLSKKGSPKEAAGVTSRA
ncbi:MAG: chloride channel protein [Nitrososphaerales archaeon]